MGVFRGRGWLGWSGGGSGLGLGWVVNIRTRPRQHPDTSVDGARVSCGVAYLTCQISIVPRVSPVSVRVHPVKDTASALSTEEGREVVPIEAAVPPVR